jgi:hypothetical protein
MGYSRQNLSSSFKVYFFGCIVGEDDDERITFIIVYFFNYVEAKDDDKLVKLVMVFFSLLNK